MKIKFFELPDRNTPRWIIYSIDIVICLCSVVLAYLLRFNFQIPEGEIHSLRYVIPFVLIVRGFSFAVARTYAGIIRYTSTRDAERIFVTISAGSLIFVAANIISFFIRGKFVLPFSILIIDFITTVFTMSAMRVFVKTLYMELRFPARE